MTLQPGQTILKGKYRILRLIGEGGMARVWLAEEPGFGARRVAIKEPLRARLGPDEQQELDRRFRQEIKLAPQLEQAGVPNVVRTYTVERLPDGTQLLVMAYVEGGSLADRIAAHPQGLLVEEAITITQDVLEALEGFHRLSGAPVHRDVKPENILLNTEGRARLSDLGLAQLAGVSSRSQLRGGPHSGTPLYMAPEQGRSPDPLTPSADLYTLGCVLFEMLTGQRCKRVQPGTAPSSLRPEVPGWLDAAVSKALAENPWDRYQSAEEMATALRQRPAGAQQVSPARGDVARVAASGRGWLWALAAVVLVAVAVGLALGMVGLLERLGTGITQAGDAAEAVPEHRTMRGDPKTPGDPISDASSLEPILAPSPTATTAFSPLATPALRQPTATPTILPRDAAVHSGGRLAFVCTGEGDEEICAMYADGTGFVQLTYSPGLDLAPAWSPDGRRIAFTSQRDGNDEIYAMNTDGTGVTRLTNNPGWDADPAWLPDGSRIAFVSYLDNAYEIFLMSADGTAISQITNLGPGLKGGLSWSPDGSRIAFDWGLQPSIYVMNSDGSGIQRLTGESEHDSQPAWSPDGSRIAFVSYRDGNGEIYTMGADGTELIRLTNNPAYDMRPAWSPDGQRIAFESDREGQFRSEIYIMNADGTGVTRLTGNAGSDYEPAWSP